MLLNAFLTEYDESLGNELNIDPLGLQVIWSGFGQQIFQNRISSISDDIRNFTLNLFNHFLIKSLVEDDSIVLGSGLKKVYDGKHDLSFKHACLVYLENLFVYSVIARENTAGLKSAGVLGISKARRGWLDSTGNPSLTLSHAKEAQVLVRQTLLGVSGRYKTPLVEMGFFDRHYRYNLPTATTLWKNAEALISKTPALSRLYHLLRPHLKDLLASSRSQSKTNFQDIPAALPKALVEAFPSSAVVGARTCDFWLSTTGLDQGAPGALYSVLSSSRHNEEISKAAAAVVFDEAMKQPLSKDAQRKLEHVRLLEPLLSELDLLFQLMLAEKSQPVETVRQRWKTLGRDTSTLAACAAAIEADASMATVLSATGQARLRGLLSVAGQGDADAQMDALLSYHALIMESRGQSPWVTRVNGSQLKIHVRPRSEPTLADRPLGSWVHQYYIPQFRHLLAGLHGVAT
ncbi:NEL domain-containing protein [Pseudomonas sp. IT-196MI5]